MARFFGNKFRPPAHRINERITSPTLRVIDSQGKQIGILSRDEALKLAQDSTLDLVEIASNANPPVAKILEYKKFLYDEKKKEQTAKKNAKDVELKELWFTPRIAEHDLLTRTKRIEEFLSDGNKVMIRVKFKGREMGNMNLGHLVIDKVMNYLGERAIIEREVKQEGRSLTLIIGRNTK